MVIFDVFTAHGASPNLSNQRRAGFAIRYMPGTSIFDRNMKVGSGQDDVQTDLGQRALFLVRGEDKTGKNDFTIGHDGMTCLLYTSPSPRDQRGSRMPSSA